MGSQRSQRNKTNPINSQQPFKVGEPNDEACPRHGERFAIRKGTARCPKGRKRNENCRS